MNRHQGACLVEQLSVMAGKSGVDGLTRIPVDENAR